MPGKFVEAIDHLERKFRSNDDYEAMIGRDEGSVMMPHLKVNEVWPRKSPSTWYCRVKMMLVQYKEMSCTSREEQTTLR